MRSCTLRACILFVSAVICGWSSFGLGLYLDDHVLAWIQNSATHPTILPVGGRFGYYVFNWILFRIFIDHPGLFHLLLTCLHLLVINELFSLLRSLQIRESVAAMSALMFALFPIYYEVVYWLCAFHYSLAAWLFLYSLRLFLLHLNSSNLRPLLFATFFYFVACSLLELPWSLCVCFVLLQLHVLFSKQDVIPVQVRSMFLQTWRSLLFVGIAGLASAIYLFFNRYSNRIEMSGGFVSVSQTLSNIVVVLRTTVSWPKRYFLQLCDGGFGDYFSQRYGSHWCLFVVLAILMVLTLVMLWRSVKRESGSQNSARLLFASLIGLSILFLPNLPMALVFPAFRSRLFYIPWIGAALLCGLVLEKSLTSLKGRWHRTLFCILSLLLSTYILSMAFVHVAIQDAFCRAWRAQKQLYGDLRESIPNPNPETRLFFVGDHKLVPTKLNLYILNFQLGCLGPSLANAFGIRHPRGVTADDVDLTVYTKEPNRTLSIHVATPRGAKVHDIDLTQLNPLAGVILFGVEQDHVVFYKTVCLVNTQTLVRIEYNLPDAAHTRGPFSRLELAY